MKVLTDWIEGWPLADRPGMYMTASEHEILMAEWTGREWRWLDGRTALRQNRKFAGLAFNPAAVTVYVEAERDIEHWFVKEAK